MNKKFPKSLVSILLLVNLIFLSSCVLPQTSGIQGVTEVDFSSTRKVQITFNEHIYDISVVYCNGKLELNFINEKDLIGGAYVSISSDSYKITYSDMVFEGETDSLSESFLPKIVYSFISSSQGAVVLDSFDEDKNCSFVTRDIDGYFVTLEAYKTDDNLTFAFVIK